MQKLNIAVFVSGSGSNLQTLIDAQQSGTLPIEIVGVISNREDAFAIQRAAKADVAVAVLSHTPSGKRMKLATFEQHALEQLNEWNVELVVLAGFMRVLSAEFINACPAPMINLHPSLLPKYKGLDTHARALLANDDEHGCSIHIVTAELDAGQVLTQAVLTIAHDDTATSLQQRVHTLEHQLLPYTLALIAKGIFTTKDATYLDSRQNDTVAKYLPKLPWKLIIDE